MSWFLIFEYLIIKLSLFMVESGHHFGYKNLNFYEKSFTWYSRSMRKYFKTHFLKTSIIAVFSQKIAFLITLTIIIPLKKTFLCYCTMETCPKIFFNRQYDAHIQPKIMTILQWEAQKTSKFRHFLDNLYNNNNTQSQQ